MTYDHRQRSVEDLLTAVRRRRERVDRLLDELIEMGRERLLLRTGGPLPARPPRLPRDGSGRRARAGRASRTAVPAVALVAALGALAGGAYLSYRLRRANGHERPDD
jgi:hypothetical protein